MKTLILDLSTSSTGYALFDGKSLKAYGTVSPSKIPGISKMTYPEKAYEKIVSVSDQIEVLVRDLSPDRIICEEVNRGINRISQKSLDALHFFVLDRLKKLDPKWLSKIEYMDSNGKTGWRGKLGLKLSAEDKKYNAKARRHNKKSKLKQPIIDWKTLAQRWVNINLDTNFDVVNNNGDADICDAIALGCAALSIKKSE